MLILTVFSCLQSVQAQTVSVTNYGFESGSLSPWSSFGAANPAVSTYAHSGTYSLSMSNADGGVFQTITNLTPGQQYVISAWVNVSAGATAQVWVDDSASASTMQVASQGQTNGWEFLSVPFTADSTGQMNLHLYSPYSGTIYWDDISVVAAVPVSNYGFESGSLSPWSSFGAANPAVSTYAHSGAYSLSMSNADGGVFQTITNLTPGQQYVTSAWVNVSAGATAQVWMDDSASANTMQVASQAKLTVGNSSPCRSPQTRPDR